MNGIFGPTDAALENELTVAKSYLDTNTKNFAFYAAFSNLAYQGLETISHSWSVVVNTELANYTVDYEGRYAGYVLSGKLTKSYGQQLTSDEVSGIVEALVSEQILAIEKSAGVNLSNP